MSSTLTIGRLAETAGVNIDTVRYYERIGLLSAATRTAAGYRHYTSAELERLRFIRRSQELGFSLEEIRQLLQLVELDGDRAEVKRLAETRLADIEQRLARLEALRDTLHTLVDACHGHGSLGDCPIVEAVLTPDIGKQELSS